MAITTLKALRAALPRVEVEANGFDVGYWLRVAGEPRPRYATWPGYVGEELRGRAPGIAAGWEAADRELTAKD